MRLVLLSDLVNIDLYKIESTDRIDQSEAGSPGCDQRVFYKEKKIDCTSR